MSEIVFLVEEDPEEGYVARALGESIFTQANTIDEIRVMILDAVRCHFDDTERPKVIRLHIVRDEVLAS
ncbi:MAG: 2-oxoisovalerate dehydrogenase [Cyanobacteria bacterium J06627_28]